MLSDTVKNRIRIDKAPRQRFPKTLVVRVSEPLYDKLNQLAADLTDESPGHPATVSDIARSILERAVREPKRRKAD